MNHQIDVDDDVEYEHQDHVDLDKYDDMYRYDK